MADMFLMFVFKVHTRLKFWLEGGSANVFFGEKSKNGSAGQMSFAIPWKVSANIFIFFKTKCVWKLMFLSYE